MPSDPSTLLLPAAEVVGLFSPPRLGRHLRAVRYPLPSVLVHAFGLRALLRAHPENVGALDVLQPLLDRAVGSVDLCEIAVPCLALLLRFGPGFHATAAIDRAEPHRGRRGGRGADSAACGARGVGGDTAVDQSQQGHGPHGGGAAGARHLWKTRCNRGSAQ